MPLLLVGPLSNAPMPGPKSWRGKAEGTILEKGGVAMYVTAHARDKVRVIRTVVPAADLVKLQDAINTRMEESFDVVVPLSEKVLDQFHGNWEYRANLKAVIRDRSLVTVYFV